MKECAAPHQEDGMCSATQEKWLSSDTGGWRDVQRHTKKMREEKEWHIAEETRNALHGWNKLQQLQRENQS